MLFTGKGDGGTTKTFGCDQRISKSSAITEALGSLDEINSFLGLVKMKSRDIILSKEGGDILLFGTIDRIQKDLFIVQAELAGADKTIVEEKVKWLEEMINGIEQTLPPVKTFFVSGGTELAAFCDVARAISRRAERRVVGVHEEGTAKVGAQTLAYLNRLSSTLYAFARAVNHTYGVKEEAPKYD